MDIKISFYLNKLTGEILDSKTKSKYSLSELIDKSFFQILKGIHPVIFVKTNDEGDYEGKAIELIDLNENEFKKLHKEDYSLSENFSSNQDIPRKFNICPHCLIPMENKEIVNQISLDELKNYFVLKQEHSIGMRYYTIATCSNCGEQSKFTRYAEKFKNTSELNVQEVLIDKTVELTEADKIFIEQEVNEIVIGKVYNLSSLPDINNIADYEAIKAMADYKDFKKVEYVKFKKRNNFFKSKEFEKKYNTKQYVK